MSLIVDKKFINLISPMLKKFSWKKADLATCRCPICGDSKTNKNKTRGFFYTKNNDMFYRCHNCNASTTLYKFIETVSPAICKEYSLERWKNGETGKSNYKKPEFKFEPTVFNIKSNVLDTLLKVSDLEDLHPCKVFVEKRKIPNDVQSLLYYAEDFGKFANLLDSETDLIKEARLVIPILDTKGRVVAAQGRALTNSKNTIRYITIKADKSIERLWYGFCRITKDDNVTVVEGPIDSLFLDNCVAMVGLNDGSQIPQYLENKKLIFAVDNEPRNHEVIIQIQKLIDNERTVCIWPNNIKEKDINEMILSGITKQDIHQIIKNNSFSGMEAKLKLQQWKKV